MTKHNVTDAVNVMDAKVNDAVQSSSALGLTQKRSGIELLGHADSIEEHDTDLRWCHSDIQLMV